MKRKLASIQSIESLHPIEGADRIEQARVMGWTVVTKKGEFAPGDRCVFFEIDAVLPETAWAEFMRPRSFRVKTAKLRGVLSQGLALPLDILPNGHDDGAIGDDVTDALGVVKYEPPAPKDPGVLRPFPSFIPKTDEIRLQSALDVIEELRGSPYYITVKIDGMSGTLAKVDGEFMACTRNNVMKEGDSPVWCAARRYDLPDKLPDGFAVQGEVCGPSIQKNRLMLEDVDLRVFSVFRVRDGRYFDWDETLAFCREHGLVPVPEVQRGERFEHSLDSLLALAKGKYDGTKNRREGIVIRPLRERNSDALRRVAAELQGHQQRVPPQGRGLTEARPLCRFRVGRGFEAELIETGRVASEEAARPAARFFTLPFRWPQGMVVLCSRQWLRSVIDG